jgi:chromosome segregation ATPase
MQVHEQRKREVAQARSKLNAVAAALELSQHDLQEQASLSSGLRKQLEELRAAASLRNQAAHNATSGATPHNTAAAAEIASLRRALEGSNQARTDMAAELAEARNVAERRDRQVRNLESIAAEKVRLSACTDTTHISMLLV